MRRFAAEIRARFTRCQCTGCQLRREVLARMRRDEDPLRRLADWWRRKQKKAR